MKMCNSHYLTLIFLCFLIIGLNCELLNPEVQYFKDKCSNPETPFLLFSYTKLEFLDFTFLCSVSFDDLALVSSIMTPTITRYKDLNTDYCDDPNVIHDDSSLIDIQRKYLPLDKGSQESDDIRSKMLSCLNFKYDVENYIDGNITEELLENVSEAFGRNTVDYILGYLNPFNVDFSNNFPSTINVVIPEKGHFAFLRPYFEETDFFKNEVYASEESTYETIEIEKLLRRDLNVRGDDYTNSSLSHELLKLSLLYSNLDCPHIIEFHTLINELGLLYLSAFTSLGLMSKFQHFKLRFNALYFPKFSDHSEILLYLALRNPVSLGKHLYYKKLIDESRQSEEVDSHEVMALCLNMIRELSDKFSTYYAVYLDMQMISRTYFLRKINYTSYVSRFIKSDLCSDM